MAYLPLSTANLPNPAIDPAQGSSPEDYFDVDTYTGTGASHKRSLSFQPDMLWGKSRSNAYNHLLMDSVRGTDKGVFPDVTNAETTNTLWLNSFDSDGYTLGQLANWNGSGSTYVMWAWKANGSGVSNTDGSITSTVSANTTSGFSICTFTDAGSAGTVGHGLGVKPDLIIQKPRSGTNDWYVFTEVIDGSFDFLNLNTTGAKNNSTLSAPTSTVFSNLQISGDTVAYCFHSVDGFSKCGSYTGNGNADGTFVYCGFRPAFLLLKVTSVADDWIIWDGVRSPENLADNALKPNSSAVEVTGNINNSIDLVSNGFKCRNTNEKTNFSGYNYIYMAFAENPFKYSNAR